MQTGLYKYAYSYISMAAPHCTLRNRFNIWRPSENGRHFVDDIFQKKIEID